MQGSDYESGWIAIHRMLREGGSWSGRERHCTFLSSGAGEFRDVSGISGLDFAEDGRAAVTTDWDGDGALDLILMSRTAPRLRLLRNISGNNRSLQLELVDSEGNTDAIGAHVEFELAEDQRQVRSVRAGSGYLAQSSLVLHFGMESATGPGTLTVRWPNGETREIEGVSAGRYRLRRGGELEPIETQSEVSALEPRAFSIPASSSGAHVPLAVRLPMPEMRATVTGGIPRELLSHYAGRPLLVMPWASWCAPCLEELRAFAAEADKLRSAGVVIVALNADFDREGRRAASRFLREIAWPFEVADADPALIDVLDLVQQHCLERRARLALPSSFLIDANAHLAVITRGPLSTTQTLLDVLSLQSEASEIRASAAPFPGTWRGGPIEPDTLTLETRLRQAGFEDIARSYYGRWFASSVQADVNLARTHLEFGKVFMQQFKLQEAVRHLREATRLDPKLVDAWRNLGIVLHKDGNRPKAIEAYRRVLELEPKSFRSRFNLAIALAESGDFEAARKEAELLEAENAQVAEQLRKEIDRLEG